MKEELLDKDKLWFAVYVDTRGLPEQDIEGVLCEIGRSLQQNGDGTVRFLVLRSKEEESRIECIYTPNGQDNEKYKIFFEKANEYIKNYTK